MTDEEILAALDAEGDCSRCCGSGKIVVNRDWCPCDRCAGTGVDQRATLRAMQAVGHLLIDVRERVTAREGGR